ncbi:translation factor, SUA5 domain [Mycoplasmopsis fermentans]|nr:translation factor, SUA5 domain [Mycoplasmopsis fermentans]
MPKTGPLFCSSANISGKPTINSYEEAIVNFKDNKSDIIFLESDFSNNSPSTIYDVDKDKILREGEISYEQITRVIKQ